MLDIIKKANKGDEDSLVKLLNIFDPLIKKCSFQLPYEEAKTDLIIFFIELIRDFKVKNFNHNGQAVNYISKAIHNKKTDLYRKYKETNREFIMNSYVLTTKASEKDTEIILKIILNSLVITDLQRNILKKNLLKVIQKKRLEKC
ncbi:helix-turn-helix domain-containing protein [Halocella sp. SP3-1]|uniref:helix-turn-helix domain-containing protein n=1 Tax=Halocella sp. SP3-1 TaxID=2382161 RepID=UPI000F753889|nr:helix-turn-helix domain-containing protein [Halocella sp. SP3-1]AZO94615.1 helix-turn-helix domain-containing protein [Halocella sp. SP3-1]